MLKCKAILAPAWAVLGGLGRWWVVILDGRAIIASMKAVWVVLGGLGRWWMVMLDRWAILASV